MLNVLFVCSRNQWRSPTAEKLWRRQPGIRVRSAGTSPRARRPLRHEDLAWADVVLCMEDKHADRIRAAHGRWASQVPIEVLGVEDLYRFMDPELISVLEFVVPPVLAAHRRHLGVPEP